MSYSRKNRTQKRCKTCTKLNIGKTLKNLLPTGKFPIKKLFGGWRAKMSKSRSSSKSHSKSAMKL